MEIFFMILYGVFAAINIAAIQYEKHTIRFASKICLVPALAVFYVTSAGEISFVIVLALFFSWVGDILLVKPRKFVLYLGILCFFATQIIHVFVFIGLVPEINFLIFIVSLAVFIAAAFALVVVLHVPKPQKIVLLIYGSAICLLVVFSLQVFIWHRTLASTLLVFGSVSFFASDAVLAYFNTVKTMTKKPLAVVMITYITAQVCIVAGYVNIGHL